MFNLLIGGAAGQGIETTGLVFEKYLKKNGYTIFSTKDLMSRVRGGHNFTYMRISREPIYTHDYQVDGILALNQDSIDLHLAALREHSFVLADESLKSEDPRVIFLPMNKLAKELGNVKAASSVAVGALIRLFSLPREQMAEIFGHSMKAAILDVNVQAAEKGYELITDEQVASMAGTIGKELGSEAKDYSEWLTLNGNQAIALGSLAAGLQFYAAYPMSPSTSIMEYLASVMDETGIVVEQAEDELAGINMAVGAAYAGAVAMTGTSGGGFQLKLEAIAMAGMQEIPVVIADAMRPGPVTGLPTRTEQGDLNMAIFAGNGEYPKAVLAVKSHEDAFYQAARAHYLAEKYQMPVILLTDQYLADGTATVAPFDFSQVKKVSPGQSPEEALAYKEGEVRGDTPSGEMKESQLALSEYKRYRVTENGISPRLIPGNPYAFVSADTDEHDEYGFITESAEVRVEQTDKRKRKLETFLKEDVQEPLSYGQDGADVLLLAWGSLDQTMKEATEKFAAKGVDVKVLVFGDVWPLPTAKLLAVAKDAKHIINVEQNSDSQLGLLIRRETGLSMTADVLKYDGRAISSEEVVDRVLEIIS